jgi:hypothetical protein
VRGEPHRPVEPDEARRADPDRSHVMSCAQRRHTLDERPLDHLRRVCPTRCAGVHDVDDGPVVRDDPSEDLRPADVHPGSSHV